MSETSRERSRGHNVAAVAARLRAARAILGISQKALAKEAGVGVAALNVLERQESSPRLETVEALELALRRHGVHFHVDRDGTHTISMSPELIADIANKAARGEPVTARGRIRRRG
ncbi:helix-turn-helix domain-containing protein [Halorhodospira sp. 9622]|uniref:helix-turn-helix domain-containing protein n=1 Tax=Halorhodospira sp. 9622 TaxID=2899136 RepID=UPI00351D6045